MCATTFSFPESCIINALSPKAFFPFHLTFDQHSTIIPFVLSTFDPILINVSSIDRTYWIFWNIFFNFHTNLTPPMASHLSNYHAPIPTPISFWSCMCSLVFLIISSTTKEDWLLKFAFSSNFVISLVSYKLKSSTNLTTFLLDLINEISFSFSFFFGFPSVLPSTFVFKGKKGKLKENDVINKRYINHSVPKDPLTTCMVNNYITNILSFVFDH